MSRPGALRSRVALFVCVSLLTSVVLPSFAEQSGKPTDVAPLRVAVAECSDGAGSTPGLAAELERSLRKCLAGQPGIEVVSLSSGRADRVLSARVAAVTASRRGDSASVEVVAEATDARTGQVAYRTTVRGEGAKRPGERASGELVARAVGRAAEQVAAQVAQVKGLRVGVISVEGADSVTVGRGADDGLVPGMELEVVRGSVVVARLRLDRVKESTATGRLFDVKPGVQVEAGDWARVTSMPSGPPKGAPKKGGANIGAIVAGVLIAGALVAFAVRGGGKKHAAADNSRLTLVAADSSLPADGDSTTTITATYRDTRGNPPPDGTTVDLTTSRGLIAPAQAELTNGRATATLTAASQPGVALVKATALGLTTTLRVPFTATSGNVKASRVFLLTSAQQLPADGRTTATITAIVSDTRNNPVPDGTKVTFTTNRGVIAPGSGVTAAGAAEAALRSSTRAGLAEVTVAVGRLTRHLTVEFVAPEAAGKRTLFLTRSAARIPADGASTATIQATVKTAANAPVPDGTQVTFSSTAGLIFPATAVTANGVATATLRSDPRPRTARITAAVGKLKATTSVAFVRSASTKIAGIFLTRDPATIAGNGVSVSKIAATARDPSNNPVPDGTPVIFTSTRGLIAPRLATTANGVAEATLRSEPTATDVTATVTASAGSRQAAITVRFTGTGAGPTRLSIIADRGNIPADGVATATLRGTLLDPTGSPVAGGQLIFRTTAGQLQVKGTSSWATQVTPKTNSQGVADVLLRSTSAPDTATITLAAPSVTTETASATVSFTSLVITSVKADPASVPVGGNKSSKVTATVVDTIGNPAPDGTVARFSIVNQAQLPSATITRSASTTAGQATAIFRSGTETGTAQIRVQIPSANAVNDQTIIGITAGPPALITVAADKFVTSARVISKDTAVTVTALVSDQFDNPVEDDTAVRFDLTPRRGGVITGTSTTTGGFATATLYPTGFVGDVTVIASTTGAGGVKIDNTTRPLVVHMGGAPVAVAIISPNATLYTPADPLQLYTEADQKLSIQLRDSSGGPADPNAQVTFQVTRGTVSPDPAPITAPLAGTATAVLRSDQPTPLGVIDRVVAVSEGVASAPLYYFLTINPAL